MKCNKTKRTKKKLRKLTSWEKQLNRLIQFVEVEADINEVPVSADDETTDVTIIKMDPSYVSKRGGLRKPSVSRCFEAETVIDFDRLWISGEDLFQMNYRFSFTHFRLTKTSVFSHLS
ncbi:unnamed protein product [Heterobilharzia americana]|nr:unnamed protein product [Heterobilharzia americana]